jgi:hypothetical protein
MNRVGSKTRVDGSLSIWFEARCRKRLRHSKIDMIEWFNGEIRGHCLDVDWD